MTDWISVKDRLPEVGALIIVSTDGVVCMARMKRADSGFTYFWSGRDPMCNDSVTEYEDPTHWMPLPEPPK